jgi:hypothetical protein
MSIHAFLTLLGIHNLNLLREKRKVTTLRICNCTSFHKSKYNVPPTICWNESQRKISRLHPVSSLLRFLFLRSTKFDLLTFLIQGHKWRNILRSHFRALAISKLQIL